MPSKELDDLRRIVKFINDCVENIKDGGYTTIDGSCYGGDPVIEWVICDIAKEINCIVPELYEEYKQHVN